MRTGRPTRVVVVGAGSAGCVVAARLSERADLDVVLLEAGPDLRTETTPDSLTGPSFVDALSEPGRSWTGLDARRARGQAPRTYVRGRGLGGSSAVNAMVALPGEPEDYDSWARDHGCTGWAWPDVAPWFDRTSLQLQRARRDEWGQVNLALGAAVPSAALGVLLTRDAHGRRVSANDAYIDPARDRPNLGVRADAEVDRVLLSGRRAVGVVLVDGAEVEADVVVMSAGAIHSPAILLRSGIDTPGVGDGLQDHASIAIGIRLHRPSAPGTLAIATTAQLSSTAGRHDVQLLPIDHVDAAFPDLGLLMAAAMRIHARGTVRLAESDPLDEPVIEFDMLSDERDVRLLDEAIAAADSTLAHPAMRAIGDAIEFDRSEAGIRAALGDYVHATSTCAMGRVVLPDGRLVGYEGVLVCDASIMPSVPRANTHLPTVMIAERIAAGLGAQLAEAARTG